VETSSTIKVVCVFGTRPEAIKMAPVVAELKRRSGDFLCKVCVTGQHRQLLDDVLRLFDIRPDHDLDVMEAGQTPGYVAASVIMKLEALLRVEQPHWVLVQGDTTTTMAASLAAHYQQVRVGHVEAGLRTYDRWKPFPEEMNRRIAACIADLHFAPTARAKDNLLGEGVLEQDVIVTGNTVIDALLEISSRPHDGHALPIDGPWSNGKRVILLTSHRRESFGPPLLNICRAVREIAQAYAEDVHIVYPVHLNPNVTGPVHRELGHLPNVSLLPPLDYLSLAHLMRGSYLILTDSGGIQEEAPSLGVPVLVIRDVTERPEAVEAGTAKVVGVSAENIVAEARRLLDDRHEYQRMARAVNPFGDGRASERIADAVMERSGPIRPQSTAPSRPIPPFASRSPAGLTDDVEDR
jgi:UDP-N-acetylglucosamine 2-epimerase (non-hydrolysing)